MSFNKNLKIEIFYNSTTLKDLAAETGINYGTILSYTSHKEITPSLNNAYLIAKALGVSIEYLITGEDSTLEKTYPKLYKTIKELMALPREEINNIAALIHELYSLNYLK